MKCWKCHGAENPSCNEPFDGEKFNKATSYVNCSPATPNDEAFCAKATGKVIFVLNLNVMELAQLFFISIQFLSSQKPVDGTTMRKCITKLAEYEEHCSDENIKMLADMIKSYSGKDADISCHRCATDGCNGASQ